MECVVFVPGTMGSILKSPDGVEVWPPSALETQFGYKRKAQLMRDDLIVGDIVRNVLCFGVYKPLIEQLQEIGFEEGGRNKRLEVFPYDWRLDLEATAQRLADRLAQIEQYGATAITIVAHSMGGLVTRLVLESGKYDAQPWFAKIKGFLALATPHLGAPLALVRILGLDSALGISGADFRELASDHRFPSGYQLLPAPAEVSCWDIGDNQLLPLDIYSGSVATRLGLDPVLLERARFVHDTLANGTSPAHVRYFYFAGAGHRTATRLNVGQTVRQATLSDDAGDGTVPMWSALPTSGQKQLVVGEHASLFNSATFKPVFYRLLGADFPRPPLGAAATLELSVQALTLRKSDPVELLLIPSAPVREIKGTITLERTTGPDDPLARFGSPISVCYDGPPVPQLKVMLDPTGEAGVFQVKFTGQPGGSPTVRFAVFEE